MTYHVRMQIFSGNPDPEWILDENESGLFRERLLAQPEMMSGLDENEPGLGYRGYEVTQLNEDEESGAAPALPRVFRIRAGMGRETEGFLLGSSDRAGSGVDGGLREFAAGAIAAASAARSGNVSPQMGFGMSCGVNYLTSSTDFSFWNDARYVSQNNCYAFGSNYRSNTFPQPGRRALASYDTKHAAGLAAGLRADGWGDVCRSSPARNLSVAAVIWPGYDFHFYRKCANGLWCHKPGHMPARNTDESGRTIPNPEYCNRGGYTQFVGYVYADSYVPVA